MHGAVLVLLLATALAPPVLGAQSGCSQGWERCENRPLCIPSGCQEGSNQNPSVRCSEGMVYCTPAAACVATCDGGIKLHDRNNPSTAQQPPRCPPAMAFCTTSGRCVGPNECVAEGRSDTICPPGTHFCPTQGGCVVGECVFHASMGGFAAVSDKADQCPPGTVFCLPEGKCSEAGGSCRFFVGKGSQGKRGQGRSGTDGTQDCGPEQIFCLTSQQCTAPSGCRSGTQADAEGSGVGSCHPGEVFCPARGRCVASSDCGGGGAIGREPLADGEGNGVAICVSGEVFCPAYGRCVASSDCGVDSSGSLADAGGRGVAICRPGEVFCPARGRCVVSSDCGGGGAIGREPLEDGEGSGVAICISGEVFCPASGRCVASSDCGVDSRGSLADAGGRGVAMCRPGEVFCLTLGKCVVSSDCASDGSRSPTEAGRSGVAKCRIGEVFCTTLGKCVASSDCGDGEGSGRSPLGDDEGSGVASCGSGEVFCFSSGRCEPEGSCLKRPRETWGNSCPPEMVYCMTSSHCVARDKGCGEGSVQFNGNSLPGSMGAAAPGAPTMVCPPSTVFCPFTGKCSEACSGTPKQPGAGAGSGGWAQACPARPPSAAPPNSTSCLYSMQCPYTYTCCSDLETQHQQCVGPEGQVAAEDMKQACFLMKGEKYKTGMQCSKPSDCPVSSICCDGSCVSLGGSSSCPSTSMFCDLTSKCHRLGDRCGKVCGPGEVYCIAQDECTDANSCEFAYTGGSAWTLPGPLLLPLQSASSSIEGVRLQDVLKIQSEVGLTVDAVSTQYGRWETNSARGWAEIKKGDVVFMAQLVRFVPSVNVAVFGAAFINVTETGTNIPRRITQLLAPGPPPLSLTAASPFLEVLEDETLLLPLGQLVNFNLDDPQYWAAWKDASAVRQQLVSSKLLDFANPSVAAFIDLLTLPQHAMLAPSGLKSDQAAVVVLKLQDSQEPILQIAYSNNSGDRWDTMPQNSELRLPLESSTKFANILLKIIPAPNVSGKTKLMVSFETRASGSAGQMTQLVDGRDGGTPGAKAEGKKAPATGGKGGSQRGFGSVQEITVEVQATNDAPVPKQAAALRRVPTLSTETKNTGFPVTKLTEIFYLDPDGEVPLGVVVLYAQNSSLGEWQYSDNAGGKWTKISNLTVFPLAQQPVLSGSYQGVVDLKQSLASTMCDMRNSVASLINNDQCRDMIRQSAAPGGAALPGSGPSLPSLQASHAQQLQAQYSGAPNGSLQVTRPSSKISGLFLPPSTLLRFLPNSSVNGTWGKIKAMTQTRLMFSAWDTSDVPVGAAKVSRRSVELLKCPLCGGDQSVSLEPVVVVAEWADCGGSPLVEGSTVPVTNTRDVCGVCHGDGTSCLDCNGDINGTATLECGKCVGGKTGRTAQRDCAGNCYTGISTTVCEMALITVEMCDKQMGSTAVLNPCGICVLGKTGLNATAGMDRCGVCGGTNDCVGCDGVKGSGKVWDICGPCVNPGETYANCTALGSVEPRMLDVALSRSLIKERLQQQVVGKGLASRLVSIADRQDVTVKADLAGVTAMTHKIIECSLVDTSGKASSIVATSTIFRGIQVMAAFRTLVKGTWELECSASLRASDITAAIRTRSGSALNSSIEVGSQGGPSQGAPPHGGPAQGGLPQRGPPPGGPPGGGRRGPPPGSPPPSGGPPPGDAPPGGIPPTGSPQSRTGVIGGAASLGIDVIVLRSLSTRNTITVVDSTSLLLAVVGDASIKNGQESKIKLQLDNNDGLNKDSRCFLKYEPKAAGEKPFILELEVTELSITGATIECLVPKTAPAGTPIVGVALLPSVLVAMQAENLAIPGKPLPIAGAAPRVVSSELSSDGRKLTVSFDSNIATKADCNNIFSNGNVLGSKYSCKIRGANLIFSLGQNATVVATTELKWSGAQGGVVQRATGASLAVTGSVTVEQPTVEDGTSFELVGDTQACNGSDVEIRAVAHRGGASEMNIVWNITYVADPPSYSRKQVLDIWESIHKMKAGMNEDTTKSGKTLVLPGTMFLPGVQYVVVPQTLAADGSFINEDQRMVVQQIPSDRTYRINIKGETSVAPGQRYRYKAEVETCLPEGDTESMSTSELKYYWTLNGTSDALQDAEGDILWMPKDLLVGGTFYMLEVVVMEVNAPANMGKGSLPLATVSQGLRAVTASDSMRVGAVNSIRLDATASVDSDNMPGDLTYRWSCTTSDGKGCFVNKDGKLQRLEVVLRAEDLRAPLLVIPDSLLPTGKYNMTLTVSKEGREATHSTALEVVGGSLPAVHTSVAEMVADPKKKVIVRATFTSGPASTARWVSMEEPGYSYGSLVGVAPTADLVTFKDPSVMRPFPLVIPAPGADSGGSWVGLLDDAVYKFRLVVTNKEGLNSYAEVQVRTNSPPSGGKLTVSPTSGKALVTEFEFSSPGWEDDPVDYPLSVTFGYQLSDDPESIVWMTPIAADDPTMTLPLPAMSANTKVTPWVRACDSHEACTEISAAAIPMSLPSDVPSDVLSGLTGQISSSISSDGSVLVGLSRVAGVLATLEAINKTDQLSIVRMIVENEVKNKITNLNGRLSGNTEAQAAASDLLAGGLLMSNEAHVSVDILIRLQALNNRLLDELSGVPHNEAAAAQLMHYQMNAVRRTPGSEIFFPKTDDDLQAARAGRGAAQRGDRTPAPGGYSEDTVRGGAGVVTAAPATSGPGRAKRAAADAEVVPTYTSMSPELVRTSIQMSEKIISSLDSQGVTSAEMDTLVTKMDTFAAGLCLSLELDETKCLAEKYVGLSVFKSQLDKSADTLFAIVDDKIKNTFINDSSYLVWGPILDQFKSWQCGRKDPANGAALSCYGACLATMQYRRIFVAPRVRDATPGKLRGNMVRSVILNPETGAKSDPRPDNTSMEYSITLQNSGVTAGMRMKCFFWEGIAWVPNSCRTLAVTIVGGVTYQKCQCPVPGYVAVFEVPVPKPGDLDFVGVEATSTTATTPVAVYQVKDIKFIIPENYTAVVGNRKKEFEKNLTTQVATRLGVFPMQIHNLTVSPGSILVELQLLKDTMSMTRISPQEDVETLYQQLLTLINSGQFELQGLYSEALTVLPVNGTAPTKAGSDHIPIIIGGVVGGILLIAIVLIIIAIYLKHKKRMDKVSSLQGGNSMAASLPPTYRSIHFEQDLDGTAASLVKQRKPEYSELDSSATYTDEDLYIERHSKSSASSQRPVLHSSAGSVGLGSISEDEPPVPAPFRYRSPSQSALDRSGPIPAHILEQIEAEKNLTPPKKPVLP